MKKIIIAVGAIVLSIIVGILVFNYFTKGKDDISFTSADNKVTITFKEVTKKDVYKQPGQIGFMPEEMESFYSDYIENSPYYLYSIANDSKIGDEETYILFKEGHYFFLTYSELGAEMYDGLRGCNTGKNEYYANVPYKGDLAAREVTHIAWSDSVGMTSYEDLLVYYSRLESSLYKANDAEKTIYLSMYDEFEDVWIESGIKLEITDTGFDITLMSEYID